MSFISHQGIIELKGRVACEMHTQEILVTELLFQNVLSALKPAEIAALLSCIVFQQVRICSVYTCSGKHSSWSAFTNCW